MTVVVDPSESAQSPNSPRTGRDPNEWRLPSSDPRDQGKHLYRLHTVDFYFWTQEDAREVTNALKKYLHPEQLDFHELHPPQDKHEDQVHPVVQNLENVAVTDPAYRNGQTRNSQNQPQTNLPPPPPPPTQQSAHSPSPVSDLSHNSKHATATTQPATQSFTPMAYNPAAPAAPEPIAPREDTPPPDDGAGGTGLAAAARHDLPYTPGPYTAAPGSMSNPYGHPGSPQVASAYGVPPQSAPAYQQQYHSSITSPATSVAPSFAGPPLSATNTNLSSTNASSFTTGPSPDRHPSVAAQHYTPQHPSTAGIEPAETPGSQFYPTHHASLSHVRPQYADYLAARPGSGPGSVPTGIPGQQQPQAQPPVFVSQPPQPGMPMGGYSNYAYDPSAPQAQQRPSEVHTQLYRPTEHEHQHSSGHRPSKSSSGGKDSSSRLDQGVDKVEKKANKLWKKIQNF